MFEMLGAFVLGGGVVALGYELTARKGGAEVTSEADVADSPSEGVLANAEAPTEAEGASAEVEATDEPDEAMASAARADLPEAVRELLPYLAPDPTGSYLAYPPIYGPEVPMDAAVEAEFPHHGLVTSLAAIVRTKPDLDSPILGVIRAGIRVRVDAERTFGGGCSQGWHKVYPMGWICRNAGLAVGETPPDEAVVSVPEPDLDAPLPYEYWRVNDDMTPFFHRLPSFQEQDRADAAGKAWYAEHGRTPMPTHPAERPADVPAVVKEYMNAGYYVTKAGEEVKSQRRFLRTTRGAYARKYQLGLKESPKFRGRVLAGKDSLPLYFIRRELSLERREAEGSDVVVKTDIVPRRLSTHPFVRSIHIGPNEYYEDADGLLMRAYAVSKARYLERPPGVGAEERWIHIDLSEQTLVAYVGDHPVFATLVSTGKQPGMTPVGVHRVQTKYVATPMRDQPPEEEAYSIDDVPWTQFFHGAVALHGAFWHAGFGLVRSHGCVNLSPADARWVFGFTDPPLPTGWHAVAPRGGSDKGSPIVVTE